MDASSSQSVSDTDSIFPEIPHQPRAFHFPKREFGKNSAVRRSFQTAWFDKWPWLNYREENDSVSCYTCLKAKLEKKLATVKHCLVEFIKKLSPIQKALIPQVHCLVSLILVMPATNATSERSFSALRRVKTFYEQR